MPQPSSLLAKTIQARGATANGEPRRLGVEIEFAGLSGENIVASLQEHFGGSVEHLTAFEFELRDSELGNFKVELDSQAIKALGENQDSELAGKVVDTVGTLAETLVPWEIVAPPISFQDLPKLLPLIDDLREAGALGTRHALHYAFGIHLNPELPNQDSATIVRFLQAYCCLYEWIKVLENTDLARRITPYINHFDPKYVVKILAADYAPTQEKLIDDYLALNPTRNRGLDMLPLFKQLDPARVERVIDDERVKARPTFHYRLPNCDIDNPDWNLDQALDTWWRIEELAFSEHLARIAAEYHGILSGSIPETGEHWADRVAQLLDLPTPA